MEISELGEFGLISQLTSDIKLENESSIKGVGDDCAILAPAEGMRTLVTIRPKPLIPIFTVILQFPPLGK